MSRTSLGRLACGRETAPLSVTPPLRAERNKLNTHKTRCGGRAMRKQPIGAFGAASLAVCGAALAVPTVVGTTTNASGIDGVVVNSVTYDVTFSTSSFDSTFSTASSAVAASLALANDLNIERVTGLSFG